MIDKHGIEVDRNNIGICNISLLTPDGNFKKVIMSKIIQQEIVELIDDKNFTYYLPTFVILDFKLNNNYYSATIKDNLDFFKKSSMIIKDCYENNITIKLCKIIIQDIFWPIGTSSFLEGNLIIRY